MTDVPAFYSDQLINSVDGRLAAGADVHTLILWTKHPAALFQQPLADSLHRWQSYGIQLALQVTITGFGGVTFINNSGASVQIEPRVPSFNESIQCLPRLVALAGNEDLITIRFDPVMKIGAAGRPMQTNLNLLSPLAQAMGANGLKRLVYSILQPGVYKKVDRRFLKAQLEIEMYGEAEKAYVNNEIEHVCALHQIAVGACCVQGLAATSCVDGRKLFQMNPKGNVPDFRMPHRRTLCGCTRSIDLGGWPPKKCPSGCLYCYANPSDCTTGLVTT